MASGSARQRPNRSGLESVWDVDSGERCQHPKRARRRDRVGRWRRGGVAGSPDRSDRVGAEVPDHPRAAVGVGGAARHDRPGAGTRSSAQQAPEYLLNGAVCRTSAAGNRARSGPSLWRCGTPEPPLRRGHLGHPSLSQGRRPRDRDRQGDRPAPPRHPGPSSQRSSIPATSAASRTSRSPPRPARCWTSPRTYPTAKLERALDEALIKRLITHAAIGAVLTAYPNRRGVGRLRALADPGRPTTETRSDGEEVLLAALRRANIPAPEVNAPRRPVHRRLRVAPSRR